MLLLTTPSVAAAYTTSAQSVRQIDETTALFAITYQFGSAYYDFYMPIRAVRDQVWGQRGSTMGFSMLEDGKRLSEDGAAVGVVVSTAEQTDDGFYIAPQGRKTEFTLYVIMKTEPNDLEADYAAAVTDLPFYRGDDREYQRLNPSELKAYQTPETEFNESNPSK